MIRARYVLDTSALLAYAYNEPGSDPVQRILDLARSDPSSCEVLIPFMALMEIHYVLLRRLAPDRAVAVLKTVESLPAEIVESDPSWREQAAEIKASGGLSVADAWIAALARLADAKLVHKDPEFDRLSGLQIVRLPDS